MLLIYYTEYGQKNVSQTVSEVYYDNPVVLFTTSESVKFSDNALRHQ